MHLRRLIPSLLVALVACCVLATPALASADQVLADWRADGTIDGTYTLAELRAADAQVNPQEREYYFWDEAYNDAMRRLTNPDAPPTKRPVVVPPSDFDNDGDIDESDIKTAAEKTAKLREKTKTTTPEELPTPPTAESRNPDNISAAEKASSKEAEEDSNLLITLFLLIPAVILGVGIWRIARKGKGTPKDDDQP